MKQTTQTYLSLPETFHPASTVSGKHPDSSMPRCYSDGRPYYSLNAWLKDQFGQKIYKLALDGGMTCPNRDGSVGRGGCIFCSQGGSGDFAAKKQLSLREQADLAKKLVEKMGGTISFESKEGTGTTFVIRIPFQIDADMKDRTETEEKTETSIQGLHVLLTEDNELNMEIAEFVLQNEGAVVTKAWNGQKAVDIFRKNRPGEFDVILMDIMMPVMNGYEAAKMIRSLDREDAKVIPIIAMTANAFTEDKMRAKEAGMDEHIAKPVDGKLLVKVINELVKRNQREKL